MLFDSQYNANRRGQFPPYGYQMPYFKMASSQGETVSGSDLFDKLLSAIDNLNEELTSIPVSIVDKEGEATHLIYSIPGYGKEDVDLTVKDNFVTVRTNKKFDSIVDLVSSDDNKTTDKPQEEQEKDSETPEAKDEEKAPKILRNDMVALLNGGVRVVKMKRNIDPKTVTAAVKDGILIVSLPYSNENVDGEKITIN